MVNLFINAWRYHQLPVEPQKHIWKALKSRKEVQYNLYENILKTMINPDRKQWE